MVTEIMVLLFKFADDDVEPQLVGQALLQPAYAETCGTSLLTTAEEVRVREECYANLVHSLVAAACEDLKEVALREVGTNVGDLFWEAHSR